MRRRVILCQHMTELELLYGGLNKAAKALGINPGYWSHLRRGTKNNPSKDTLNKLGIKECIYYVTKEGK